MAGIYFLLQGSPPADHASNPSNKDLQREAMAGIYFLLPGYPPADHASNPSNKNLQREAQQAPSVYAVFNLIRDGKLLADRYISTTRFKNILNKEK